MITLPALRRSSVQHLRFLSYPPRVHLSTPSDAAATEVAPSVETQEKIQPSSPTAGMYEYRSSENKLADWRPFIQGSWVKPSHFTYRSRVDRTHFPARPLVAPKTADARYHDVFRQLEIDPLTEIYNSRLFASFLTTTGRIKNRKETGLTSKTQRRLGKAIRRAKAMGLLPWLRHPFRYGSSDWDAPPDT